jgi:hypothetical protein
VAQRLVLILSQIVGMVGTGDGDGSSVWMPLSSVPSFTEVPSMAQMDAVGSTILESAIGSVIWTVATAVRR